jgi:hypothetical protein
MSEFVRPTRSIEIFFSYSHADEGLRDELEKHLSVLKRTEEIACWHDRKVTAGRNWEKQIDTNLERSQVILLLISPDFIASDYCYSIGPVIMIQTFPCLNYVQ